MKSKLRIILLIVIFVILTKSLLAKDLGKFKVKAVLDGDTIVLDNDKVVRLIGVDTPESKFNRKFWKDVSKYQIDELTMLDMGLQASEYTRNLLLDKEVRVETDLASGDIYGRMLGYVYIDESLVNKHLIESCYGRPLFYWPNTKYKKEFTEIYEENCK